MKTGEELREFHVFCIKEHVERACEVVLHCSMVFLYLFN